MFGLTLPRKILATACLLTTLFYFSSTEAAPLPAPKLDAPLAASAAGTETSVVLAGGCFWGMQGVFQHVKGVQKVVSGYAGGNANTAQYEVVSTGTTGHAESVKITYDPAQISLGKLLQIYFAVAHDPTEFNYQGPDHGTQYRSAIFYATPEQQKIAAAYIAQLHEAHAFSSDIATKLEPLNAFYPAEAYHQDYMRLHPDAAYIKLYDAPKLENLKKQFPDIYVKD